MKKILLISLFVLLASISSAQEKMPESRWASMDKTRIHYYDIGSQKNKTAIVFIHGWTCSADFWRGSYNEFPQNRVIAIDLVGHGQSDRPNAIYSMELFAKSVEAVLTKAKVDKAVLVGHSMGTPVARQFYRLFPQKVAGIVIVDGALRPFASSEVFEQYFAPVRSNYAKNAPGFMDGMLNDIKDVELRTWIRERMLATRAPVALSAMDAMLDPSIWGSDKISVPVLAVMAESQSWKPDEEEFFRSVAPNLEFRMWKSISHFLMMEKPAEFNTEIKAFVAKNKLL